jgi:hypothetical protein
MHALHLSTPAARVSEPIASPRPYEDLNESFASFEKALSTKNPLAAQKSMAHIKVLLKTPGAMILPAIRDHFCTIFLNLAEFGKSHDFVDTHYAAQCDKLLDMTFATLSQHLSEDHWTQLADKATSKMDQEIYWSMKFLSNSLNHLPRETIQKMFDVSLESASSPYCAPLYPTLIKTIRGEYSDRLSPQQLLNWKAWVHESSHQAIPAQGWQKV